MSLLMGDSQQILQKQLSYKKNRELEEQLVEIRNSYLKGVCVCVCLKGVCVCVSKVCLCV
jgi:hypothetical protein